MSVLYKVKKRSERDDFIGVTIKFFYYIFSAQLMRTLFTIFMTVYYVPYVFLSVNFKNFSLEELMSNSKILRTLIFFIVIELLFLLADKYDNLFKINYQGYQKLSELLKDSFTSWSRKLYSLKHELVQDNTLENFKIQYHKHSNYNHRLTYLSNKIYNFIEAIYEIKDHQISIMHKASDEKGEFIKMIVNTGLKLQVFTGTKLQVPGKNILEVNDSYFQPVFHPV